MWQVNIGNSILYYPANDDFVIYDTALNEEVGLAGEFTFKVPPTNPLYSSLSMGALITVFKDGTEYWRGEIKELHTDFQKVVEVYCVEDLAWLGDEYLAPASVKTQTYAQRFQTVIATYNQNRPAERQFTAGYVSNVSGTCNWTTEYEWSILDSFRNCICKDDGYIRVRRVTALNGTVTRYIDIIRLQDYGTALQPIQFGYNLLDFVKESDYGNLTNILTPYGDPLKDSSGNPVYVYGDYEQRLQGTTIQNNASINMYGRHAKSVVFDGVTNVTALNNLASAYLSRYCQPQLTMEVKAVDLGDIENVEDINLGNSVQIIAEPFGIDQNLYLTQLQRDLQDVSKNTLTLSGHVQRRSLTSQLLETAEMIEELPTEASILEAAKKNAVSMLLDETQGGYVVYEYDTNNKYIVAINICNARTIAESVRRWRWSYNGLAFLTRQNTGASWPAVDTSTNVAITNNGAIVADKITTGSMSATRIRGGALYLGGSENGNYKNGSFYIYNANDKRIGAWTKNGMYLYDETGNTNIGSWTPSGIYVNKGSINLGGGVFQVTNEGKVTASDLTINGGSIKLGKKQRLDAFEGLYLGSDGISLGKNNTFVVDKLGAITAKSGEIGSFTIDSDSIRSGEKASVSNGAITLSTKDFQRTINSAARTLRFAIGSKFGVGSDGKLYASGVDISGAINASSGSFSGTLTSTNGKIANFEIRTNIISTQENTSSTASGSVTLASADFTRHINGADRALRFAIGSKFGIASDGTLYATAGVFKGNITGATGTFSGSLSSASISSCTISGTTITGSSISGTSLTSEDGTGTKTTISGGLIHIWNNGTGEKYLTLYENGRTLQIGGQNVAIQDPYASPPLYISLQWADIMRYLDQHV